MVLFLVCTHLVKDISLVSLLEDPYNMLQHGSKKCVNPKSGVSISHFFRLRLKWVHFKMVVLIVFAVVITTASLGEVFECMAEYESWFFLCSLNKPVQYQVAVTVVLSCGLFISETNVGDF